MSDREFHTLFHTVLHKLITLVVIATGQTFQFSGFLQLPSSSVPCSDRVRAAAQISAGGEGSPYNQLSAESYPT